MITNYDLIQLGFSPKYNGFHFLKNAINLKISEPNLTLNGVYTRLDFYNSSNIERNIRTLLRNSNNKYTSCMVSKVVNSLAKEYKNVENTIKVKFEKVSFKQWCKDVQECGFKFSKDELKDMYDRIKLPVRATSGSAGYDFFAPFDLNLKFGETLKFPTGIKCLMNGDIVLMLYPRSGLGFKYGLQLYNTCGVIDSDYMLAKNEGHIHCKFQYLNKKVEEVKIASGDGYMQGLIIPFYKTVDDKSSAIRTGGFGSTTKKEK